MFAPSFQRYICKKGTTKDLITPYETRCYTTLWNVRPFLINGSQLLVFLRYLVDLSQNQIRIRCPGESPLLHPKPQIHSKSISKPFAFTWTWLLLLGSVYKSSYLFTTTTTTTTTTVLRPFVRDYPGELVPEETLTHPPSWSSSNLYQLLPSTTIHSILLVQNTCLVIFLHNLCPCPLWSTSWSGALHSYSIHFFTQSVSSFRSTCPYHPQPVLL